MRKAVMGLNVGCKMDDDGKKNSDDGDEAGGKGVRRVTVMALAMETKQVREVRWTMEARQR